MYAIAAPQMDLIFLGNPTVKPADFRATSTVLLLAVLLGPLDYSRWLMLCLPNVSFPEEKSASALSVNGCVPGEERGWLKALALLSTVLLASPECQVFDREEERWALHTRSLQSSRVTDGEEVIRRVMGCK